ncbi:hypothetical protein Acsp03_09870 [Actinomadura sp. NBRC 104412]|nr:hypothetical protein Acsp03_09870 [Actinomadura sp. NBRC 104412]
MPHDSSRGRASPRPPHLTPVPTGARGSGRRTLDSAAVPERPGARAGEAAAVSTPLSQAVEKDGPLSEADLHKLALRTAKALARRHKEGTMHGSLHPGNVILAPEGAKVSTAAREVPPSYLAPEQVEDEPVGPPADVFAWGATLVYAATGRPPFGTGPDAAVLRRVTSRRPDLGDLEGPLRELVARCLDKNPAARPTSRQVVRALRDGRTPTPKPRPKRIPRYRWRMMVALAAVIAMGFVMGVLV